MDFSAAPRSFHGAKGGTRTPNGFPYPALKIPLFARGLQSVRLLVKFPASIWSETGGQVNVVSPLSIFFKREPQLFHNQVVFHRCDTPNAAGNLSCLFDTLSRIDRTA